MNCNNCRRKGMYEKCHMAAVNPEYANLCRSYEKRKAAYPNVEFEAAVRDMLNADKRSPYAGMYIDRSRR